MREGCSYTYPPLSIARYSCMQLSELEQFGVKQLAQGFNTGAQDSNPGSRSRESEALPLSHCALHNIPTSYGISKIIISNSYIFLVVFYLTCSYLISVLLQLLSEKLHYCGKTQIWFPTHGRCRLLCLSTNHLYACS